MGARRPHPNPHAAPRKSLKSNEIIMSRTLRARSERHRRRLRLICEPAPFFCEVSAHQAKPAGANIKREHGRIRDVEALDLAGHVEPRHHAAGFARQLPQTLALRAEYERERLL